MEMVEYQAKKSAVRFWDDRKRMKVPPAEFNQEWFATWKNQEVNKLNVEYVYGMFKKFVRSTMTTEGMAPNRSFPRLVLENGEATFIPIEVSHDEWSDPALSFRDLAQFTNPDVQDLWTGLDFTTTDLILEVVANFHEFMEWFATAVTSALDKIRDAARLMITIQDRFEWVEKINVKVFKFRFTQKN